MADEGFLQRWSRRKAEARTASEAGEPEQETALERAELPQAAEPREPPASTGSRPPDDVEAAVDLEALPDIDTLTYESDFTAFMRKGVPPELRKRALQRLWRSNPTLANLDGLVEYGEDYTKIGTAKQVVRTAYRVGRGMLRRIDAEAAREAAPADAAASAGAQQPSSAPEPVELASEEQAGDATPTIAAARAKDGAAPARGDERPAEPSLPSKPRPLPKRG